jgi:glycosyltransferase involved in cell wall biosynthesis
MNPRSGDQAFDVTVSIATYDRAESLERTLRSCLEQTNRLGLRLEVLVTDNHPSGNARALVEATAAQHTLPIRYQSNTTRNMSDLRNAGIKAARGAFIAFIDDDEFADPNWMDELFGSAQRTGADIVVGPRLATFVEGRPPAYDPSGRFFERNYPLAADAKIPLTDPDGRPRYGLGTGNSLFRVSGCLERPEPFDPAFGDAGGEDIELFVRLYRAGRSIVWAPRAIVTETVVQNRTRVAYRLIRARRETQIFAAIYMAHTPCRGRTWMRLMLTGLAQVVLGGLGALATFEFGSQRRIRGRLMLTVGLGKLSWRKPVGYIDETHSRPAPRAQPRQP